MKDAAGEACAPLATTWDTSGAKKWTWAFLAGPPQTPSESGVAKATRALRLTAIRFACYAGAWLPVLRNLGLGKRGRAAQGWTHRGWMEDDRRAMGEWQMTIAYVWQMASHRRQM